MPDDSPEARPVFSGLPPSGTVLHLIISREMWGEFFTLHMDNGQTEELDPEEVRKWFKERGADMDKIEKVLDHVWNFGRAEVEIETPRTPTIRRLPYEPNI